MNHSDLVMTQEQHNDSTSLPLPFQRVIVRTERYICLAYRNTMGQWWNPYADEEVQGVIDWWPIDSYPTGRRPPGPRV